jgi:hypothetical protein
MKKILGLALAAAVAVAGVMGTSESVLAAPHHHFVHRHQGGLFIAPFLFAPLFGWGMAGVYPHAYGYGYGYPYGAYYGGNSHVQWCLAHYRTYNPATNMYIARPGVWAVCYTPFGY